MGFFNKKVCDICGGDIGLLGNKKLADGNLCKDCARKLSPWMTDRRESTVEEIRQHLMYRAQNQRALAGVHPTAVVGANTKVYIDQNARKFFVTSATNWRDANPDLIDFSQVVDVQTEVTEHRTEEYRYYEQQADALRAVLMSANAANTTAQGQPQGMNLADALARAINQVAGAAVGTAANAAPRPAAPRAAAPKTVPAESGRWTCACGTVNEGNFCTNCGAKRPEKKKVFRCDKCGWTPEDPTNPPRFCPNCGDPFTAFDEA